MIEGAATARDAEIDARMTAHRRETKYLISPDQAKVVARVVARELESHRHRGEGANRLPAAHHYVTTIYFDTSTRALYRASQTSADSHLKLRAKEYYDLQPGLTETATDPRQLVRFQPVLWLEIKSKEGGHTGKQRIGIPKHDVPAFFGSGTITPAMTQLQDRAVLDAVAALCARCAEPLVADCLVNYRRTAWQDPAGELRVTIDTGLAFFAPPADLWERDWALVRPTLGRPAASEERRVLEIKSHGDVPAWLATVLREQGIQPVAFSKFEAASSAIHG